MPDSVKDAFLKIFREYGQMTDGEAEQYHEMLQKNKRYQQETWS